MCPKISLVYNDPLPSRYSGLGEGGAISSVLDEVKAVAQALAGLGYQVTPLALQPPLSQVRASLAALDTELVFNLFEGFDGRPETEAEVVRIMEELGLTFTGSPSSAIALAQNKAEAKQALLAGGLSTPNYQVLLPETLPQFRLGFPCIAKPLGEDASHGISPSSVVNDLRALERQVMALHQQYDCAVLVEQFLDGREFNATVVGADRVQVFPPSEIIYTLTPGLPRILTYSAKWETEAEYYRGTRVKCPADVDAALRVEIADLASGAFQALGCRGYARVDMRQNAAGRLMVLEVNSNPDISPDAGASLQARAAGLTYTEFIQMIVSLAGVNRQSDVDNQGRIAL
ncbi:MAG: hypothetical protein HY669_00060 [Chloroflexi bacterium]|nr:hypothetical protein [Chloroflexota bacterium]